jgi:hypothetical protein
MTKTERSQAYGRVMTTLREVGPTKLLPAEQETIREAADTLFFTEDLGADDAARGAVEQIEELRQHLVDSERWLPERAQELVSDVLACGPVTTV